MHDIGNESHFVVYFGRLHCILVYSLEVKVIFEQAGHSYWSNSQVYFVFSRGVGVDVEGSFERWT